jgi:hypothetical protein
VNYIKQINLLHFKKFVLFFLGGDPNQDFSFLKESGSCAYLLVYIRKSLEKEMLKEE